MVQLMACPTLREKRSNVQTATSCSELIRNFKMTCKYEIHLESSSIAIVGELRWLYQAELECTMRNYLVNREMFSSLSFSMKLGSSTPWEPVSTRSWMPQKMIIKGVMIRCVCMAMCIYDAEAAGNIYLPFFY
jgi:hypothetical protein